MPYKIHTDMDYWHNHMLEPAYLSAGRTHLMSNKTKLEQKCFGHYQISFSDSHVIVGWQLFNTIQ